MTPVVSVVTPFHNAAPYLRECIEGVLKQSLTDFEFILLDTCSTDGSGAIAAEYAPRDARLRVVAGPHHVGQIDNCNRVLGHVSPRSTYVKMLGADDWLYPECLGAWFRWRRPPRPSGSSAPTPSPAASC
jgi:glycosyltransferase involved in cell wall biosynthesis